MAYYLVHRNKGKNYYPIVFSAMFALSSFIIGYYFNLMWLDSIAMLPLIMMGIERIVNGKSGKLFCLSLFYGLFCNYYIGFMLCLFSCLYFLVLWISAKKITFKRLRYPAENLPGTPSLQEVWLQLCWYLPIWVWELRNLRKMPFRRPSSCLSRTCPS